MRSTFIAGHSKDEIETKGYLPMGCASRSKFPLKRSHSLLKVHRYNKAVINQNNFFSFVTKQITSCNPSMAFA